MSKATATNPTLPPLVLNALDHDRLTTMANGNTGPMADVAEQLLIELDRAEIVTPDRFPADAVGMGSIVSFKTTDGFDRTFQLVYPGEADINAGKVSVLTPIGAALIGLRAGQTIPWTARDGRHLRLTVLSVRQGE